tara:strand:+ start:4130 stop:4552 length:423 start_codon:yes stop_codon:yes gene_type:complete
MGNLKKIKVFELKKFKNTKGNVLRGFRKTDKYPGISAEIYFSWINKKAIKGWKLHKKMTMNLIVPVGTIKFVFYEDSKFKEIIIGDKNYSRIYVPNNIFFAFQNLSTKKSLVVNNASIIHQKKNEIVTKKLNEIDYKWKR